MLQADACGAFTVMVLDKSRFSIHNQFVWAALTIADTPKMQSCLTTLTKRCSPWGAGSFCSAFDAVHRIIIRAHLNELRLIGRLDDGRFVRDSMKRLCLILAAIFLMFAGVMCVPIAFLDRHCSLSKQWLDAVAVRNGEVRSVGKGYEH
jgi:hypothetical protein